MLCHTLVKVALFSANDQKPPAGAFVVCAVFQYASAKAPAVDFLPGFLWVWTPKKTPVARSRLFKPDCKIPSGTFSGRSILEVILARKWLAKMTQTRQNENENFKPLSTVAIRRNWDGAIELTPRTPRS